jgi:hypothetical protein
MASIVILSRDFCYVSIDECVKRVASLTAINNLKFLETTAEI